MLSGIGFKFGGSVHYLSEGVRIFYPHWSLNYCNNPQALNLHRNAVIIKRLKDNLFTSES